VIPVAKAARARRHHVACMPSRHAFPQSVPSVMAVGQMRAVRPVQAAPLPFKAFRVRHIPPVSSQAATLSTHCATNGMYPTAGTHRHTFHGAHRAPGERQRGAAQHAQVYRGVVAEEGFMR